jgi:hypothetical protein
MKDSKSTDARGKLPYSSAAAVKRKSAGAQVFDDTFRSSYEQGSER